MTNKLIRSFTQADGAGFGGKSQGFLGGKPVLNPLQGLRALAQLAVKKVPEFIKFIGLAVGKPAQVLESRNTIAYGGKGVEPTMAFKPSG